MVRRFEYGQSTRSNVVALDSDTIASGLPLRVQPGLAGCHRFECQAGFRPVRRVRRLLPETKRIVWPH